MATLLKEVEFIVNERPLTHVGGLDEPQPLTPNLLLGRQIGSDDSTEASLEQATATRRLKYLTQLRRHLDGRWTEEYLLSLRGFHQLKSHSLAVGDLVLVVSDKRRQAWKMALILELYPGVDGGRRVAKIRIGQQEFLRPVQRLVPLEISAATTPTTPAVENSSATPEGAEQPVPAPTAKATSDVAQHRTRSGRLVQPPARLDV